MRRTSLSITACEEDTAEEEVAVVVGGSPTLKNQFLILKVSAELGWRRGWTVGLHRGGNGSTVLSFWIQSSALITGGRIRKCTLWVSFNFDALTGL